MEVVAGGAVEILAHGSSTMEVLHVGAHVVLSIHLGVGAGVVQATVVQ